MASESTQWYPKVLDGTCGCSKVGGWGEVDRKWKPRREEGGSPTTAWSAATAWQELEKWWRPVLTKVLKKKECLVPNRLLQSALQMEGRANVQVIELKRVGYSKESRANRVKGNPCGSSSSSMKQGLTDQKEVLTQEKTDFRSWVPTNHAYWALRVFAWVAFFGFSPPSYSLLQPCPYVECGGGRIYDMHYQIQSSIHMLMMGFPISIMWII